MAHRCPIGSRETAPPPVWAESAREHDLLHGGRHLRQQRRALRDVADSPSIADITGGAAQQLDLSRPRLERAEQHLEEVDFLDPLGPTRATNSPARTERVTS